MTVHELRTIADALRLLKDVDSTCNIGGFEISSSVEIRRKDKQVMGRFVIDVRENEWVFLPSGWTV